METWTSPDDKIFKKILLPGEGSVKPYEGSKVRLEISGCPKALLEFNKTPIEIGDFDGCLGRALDICITTMYLGERAQFTVTLDLEEIVAVVQLVDFEFNDFIYQWSAKKKMDMALKHKAKGTEFFTQKNHVDAAYRFTKALKIASSIPVDVERTPEIIDGVALTDIKELKKTLYNNLSSCYFREQKYDFVIPLCDKVLFFDDNNVKALYKIGVAYEHDRDYEKADEALSKVMEIEPQNKACAEHLANVKKNLKQASGRVNDMMKKMIIGGIGK